MHHLLDMAQYTMAVDAFDKVYRNMIVEYTKYHMTPIKHDMSHALRRRSRNRVRPNLIEQVVNQYWNVDPEGWMVHKSIFVENYINVLSILRNVLCLCVIDNSTELGLVV